MPPDTPHPQLHATPPSRLAWLVVLALVWALVGLTGRDAWQADEAIALGQVLDWLRAGRLPIDAALHTWVAGAATAVLQGLGDTQAAARFASSLFALTGLLFTGLAARSLYGTGYGVIAVLLLMGAFGLTLRVHALLPETAMLAGYALLLYGLAESRRGPDRAWAILLGALSLFLTRGLPDLIAALLIALVPLVLPGFATRGYRRALLKAGLGLLTLLALWLALLASEGLLTAWWEAQLSRLTDLKSPRRLMSTLAWFAWPAWPLALWALWHQHRRLGRENPLHLPLVAALVTLPLGLVPAYTYDGLAMPALVPLTLLATFGIATLRRGAAQAFYWFGATSFVFFALAFWLHYLALDWGWPHALAAHLQRMTPGYTPRVALEAVAWAAAATLLWLIAMPLFPRAQVRPALVWATGMTLSWVLLITLLKPWAELSWGYRPVATAIAAHLPAGVCVRIDAQGAPRVMLEYHLAHALPARGRDCDWRVEVVGRDTPVRTDAQLVWEGRRPREKRELYRLYRIHEGAP